MILKGKKQVIAGLCLLLSLVLALSSCKETRPAALLHSEGDDGYIPCISNDGGIEISADQAFVYDTELGGFIYLKGERRVIYPASTTKLLTILYALTILSPDELVSPGDELSLVAPDSSIAYIKEGHTLSVEMLIEGMLLPSGNDAAYVLAAAAGRRLCEGDGDAISGKEAVGLFMDGMNSYAKEIGLCGSSFKTPDGYADEDHYSTIEDIAIVSRLAYENEIIKKYSAMAEDDVVYASGHTNHWVNTNLMLDPESPYYEPCVTGLKTGSLGKGNYSLICSVRIVDKEYIIGVFSAEDKNARFLDMQTIIDRLKVISA